MSAAIRHIESLEQRLRYAAIVVCCVATITTPRFGVATTIPRILMAVDKPRSFIQAQGGSARGDFEQAQHLLLSEGLRAPKQVLDLLRSGADKRDPLSEYDLGYCYESGIGTAVDIAQALWWYRRAATDADRDDLRSVAQLAIQKLEPLLATATNSPAPQAPKPAADPAFTMNALAPIPAPPVPASSDAMREPDRLEVDVTTSDPQPAQQKSVTTGVAVIPYIAGLEVPTAPLPSDETLSPAIVNSLINRGKEMLRTGNISAARLLFTRAALAGNGEAAMTVGETYDPRFLMQIGVKGLMADPVAASSWYHHAASLGNHDADRLLVGLDDKPEPGR
jgi:TPR repeat protein